MGYLAIGHLWSGVGFLCLLVAVVSEVLDQNLGLEVSSWYQLGIGLLIVSAIQYFLWYVKVKK